jgi:hypothetical protein
MGYFQDGNKRDELIVIMFLLFYSSPPPELFDTDEIYYGIRNHIIMAFPVQHFTEICQKKNNFSSLYILMDSQKGAGRFFYEMAHFGLQTIN